ncbi:Methylene-tetrahydromethanopterin dehydrogenase [Hyphomicrobium denitrificans ATCC 51888]|uniref:Methylene-tetrahydromethanopterin dehydrogenase n=1 Tax=Hyphomicrobium denitrificans (strain ATCC 51888 / DSM 1869 / NCIMB 11706 / TK 0415) TaxID=582899 RepID=D8JXT2_HYPDA|nr:NAD(P)-dependent methylenetetrahydromethanopterin dehydrogenase [Hyphomicrobium denitrificans]ADJ23291.1 Methylene-tetrahydromethanopterin dehydrogenase [Hyphomicrobium denitrificans ATCC 51888]
MSEATPILHMLAPQKHMSPFDVNMAADAGYKVIVPYINVELNEVAGLIQDAIFSRPPNYGVRTGFFMGGKDAILALDMIEAAKKAMVPPFECSVFADPAGSFTTAAAMVACVEKVLKDKFNTGWKGVKVAVFGATGVVGFASSIISALEGADVRLVAHRGVDRVIKSAKVSKERFGVDLEAVAGETPEQKADIIANADVIFAAAAAGVQVVSGEHKKLAKHLKVIADVNAVPPAGVEGMELFMNGDKLPGCDALGVGPLAIGDIKYKCESGLFKQMLTSDKPLALDFRHAYAKAKELVGI